MPQLDTEVVLCGACLEIRALKKTRGRCELSEFLDETNKKHPGEHLKILALLERAASRGIPENIEKFRIIKGSTGIYEFKTTKIRILCFKDGDRLIVCTHGFLKQSQKTPPKEIKKAENLKKEYYLR